MSKIKHIAAGLALALFMVAGLGVAFATSDAPTGSGQVNRIYGLFKSTPSTLSDGEQDAIRLDSKGGLVVAGNVASDGVDSGYPLKIGGKATTYGGGVSAVADLDRVDGSFDLVGALRVAPAIPRTFWSGCSYSAVNSTPTAITVAAGASGVRHVCTGLQFSVFHDGTGTVSAATGFTFAVLDGTTVKWKETISFPVGAGAHVPPIHINFPTPIVGTAATDMVVTCADTAALLHSGMSLNAQGYDTK